MTCEDDAMQADERGAIIVAAQLYERAQKEAPDNIEIRLDTAFYYCYATDTGVENLYVRQEPEFSRFAWGRCRELAELGMREFPQRPEFEFWRQMFDWLTLSKRLDRAYCRQLLATYTDFLDPAAYLFSTSRDSEARVEARRAKELWKDKRSRRYRYLQNCVKRA